MKQQLVEYQLRIVDLSKVLSFVPLGDGWGVDGVGKSDPRGQVLPYEALRIIEKIRDVKTGLFASLNGLPERYQMLDAIEAYHTRSKNASQQLDGLAKLREDLQAIEGGAATTPQNIKAMSVTLQKLQVDLKTMPKHLESLTTLSAQLSPLVLRAVTEHVEQHLAPFMASVALRVKNKERPPALPTLDIEVLRDSMAHHNNQPHVIFRAHDELPRAVFLMKFLMKPENSLLKDSSAQALLQDQPLPAENPDEEAQFPAKRAVRIVDLIPLWDSMCAELRACSQKQETVQQLDAFTGALAVLGKDGLRSEGKRCQAHIKAQVARSLEADNPGSASFNLAMCEQMERFASVKILDTADECRNSAQSAAIFFKWAREALNFINVQASVDELSTKPSNQTKQALQGLSNMRGFMSQMQVRGLNPSLVDILGNDPDELQESKELGRKSLLTMENHVKDWDKRLLQSLSSNIKEALNDLQSSQSALPAWALDSYDKLAQADVSQLADVTTTSRSIRKAVQLSATLANVSVAELEGYEAHGQAIKEALTAVSIVTVAKLNDSPKWKDMTPEQASSKGTAACNLVDALKRALDPAESQEIKLPEPLTKTAREHLKGLK